MKTQVVEDAILLAMKSAEEQLRVGKGKLFNSYKLLVDRLPAKVEQVGGGYEELD